MTPWKVYFEGSLWGHRGRDHAGWEITVGKSFSWGKQMWVIPAVYVCARGLVLDVCAGADADEMRRFVEKWLPYESAGKLSEELREENERENPLRMDAKVALICDGQQLREKHASGTVWLPESCIWEGYQNGKAAEAMMTHYGLDRALAWGFRRIMCPWGDKGGKRQIRELTLFLEAGKVSYSGPRFFGSEETVTFFHPITGKEHTLTVIGEEEQELPNTYFQRENLEYPRKCVVLAYTANLEKESLQVRWCGAGDRPREKSPNPKGPTAAHAAGVIMLRDSKENRTAASALYFALPEKREWRVIVMEKPLPDVEWRLLGEEK